MNGARPVSRDRPAYAFTRLVVIQGIRIKKRLDVVSDLGTARPVITVEKLVHHEMHVPLDGLDAGLAASAARGQQPTTTGLHSRCMVQVGLAAPVIKQPPPRRGRSPTTIIANWSLRSL
jgi:hypothetical protein